MSLPPLRFETTARDELESAGKVLLRWPALHEHLASLDDGWGEEFTALAAKVGPAEAARQVIELRASRLPSDDASVLARSAKLRTSVEEICPKCGLYRRRWSSGAVLCHGCGVGESP